MTQTKEFSLTVDLPNTVQLEKMYSELQNVFRKHAPNSVMTTNFVEKLVWQNGILSTEAGKELILSTPESILFTYLAKHPNQTLSFDSIVNELARKGIPTNQTNFRVMLHRLRKKLGSNQGIIQTERDYGYSLRTGNTLEIR
jgi:DNA-binding response OmpR family regulator